MVFEVLEGYGLCFYTVHISEMKCYDVQLKIYIFLPWPLPEKQAMVLVPPIRAGQNYHQSEQTRTDMFSTVCNRLLLPWQSATVCSCLNCL